MLASSKSCKIDNLVSFNISSRKLIEKLGLTYQKKVQLPNVNDELRYYEMELKKETH